MAWAVLRWQVGDELAKCPGLAGWAELGGDLIVIFIFINLGNLKHIITLRIERSEKPRAP